MKQEVKYIICCFITFAIFVLSSCNHEKDVIPEYTKKIESNRTSVNYSIKKLTFKTNELLEFILQVITDDDNIVKFPESIPIEKFNLVERLVNKEEAIGTDSKQAICHYILEPTIPGDYTIPPLRIRVKSKTNHSDIALPKVKIKVISLFAKGEPVEIKSLMPQINEQSNNIFILVTIMIAIAALIFLFKAKKIIYTESKTPIEQAKLEISKLQATDANYASKLRKLLIKYLAQQVNQNLNSASNEEIIDILSKMRIFNSDLLELTEELLNNINRSMFSKDNIDTQELCTQALEFLARSSVSFDVSKEFNSGTKL